MLVACIAATPSLAQTSEDELTSYVRARAADADGAADIAAAGYAAALKQLPDDQLVAFRAYRQGVAAGDYALAARATAALVKGGAAPPDTAVFDVAVALAAGNRAAADAALARMKQGPLDFMAPVVAAWMAFDRGEDPIPLLDPIHGNALERRYAAENRALLLIAVGRTGEGLAALRPLLAPGRETEDLRIDAALLLASGRPQGYRGAGAARRRRARARGAARADRSAGPAEARATARRGCSSASPRRSSTRIWSRCRSCSRAPRCCSIPRTIARGSISPRRCRAAIRTGWRSPCWARVPADSPFARGAGGGQHRRAQACGALGGGARPCQDAG